MAKTKITLENISEFLNSLPYTQFKALVENYAECNQNNFDKEMKRLVTMDLQKRLEALNINSICPQCGSSIVVKNGKKSKESKNTNAPNAITNLHALAEPF